MKVFCSRKENLCKMAKIYSEKPSYCCMFHISTGLAGEPKKKYTKKYTADPANNLKLEELTEKLTEMCSVK